MDTQMPFIPLFFPEPEDLEIRTSTDRRPHMTDTTDPTAIAARAVAGTEEPGGMGVAYELVMDLVVAGLITRDQQDAAWNEALQVVVPLWNSRRTDQIPQAAVDALRTAGYLT